MSKRLLAVLPVLLGTALDAQRPSPPRTRDSAGIRIIENATIKTNQIAFTIDSAPTLALGGLPDDARAEFDSRNPYSLAMRLSDGRIVATDRTSFKMFDARGRFIRTVGRSGAGPRQVSNGGGNGPLWSRDGRELFFVSADKHMMAARLSPGTPITVGEPVALFRVPDALLAVESLFYTPWDVAPDGRFIMARLRSEANSATTIVVAESWLAELKAKMRR
jgi:hypothetical protein